MKKIDYKTIIPILAIVIIQAIFVIVVTNKVVELENKIDNIKLINNMFYEDLQRTYEFKEELK
jgi:hypothetical protein|uniref:Uncharacterized protein n=1 Tax=Siphoviridae sp. ctMYJ33 TaxID=2825461 RepID=A0A8S5PB53_9CAUD|nr:MAG TPA: hypothetical protein [Siphoviridae sp. ctMYJ33]